MLNKADKKNPQRIVTGTPAALDIRGETEFAPTAGGVHGLGIYVNLHLPPRGSVARRRLARGGVTVWFEQTDPTDHTGFLGPIPVSVWAGDSLLIAHTWNHGVSEGRPWRFMVLAEAFTKRGTPVRVPLTIGTRNVRID